MSSNLFGTAAFSPDGTKVLSAGLGIPTAWDAGTGEMLFEVDGAAATHNTATWSPDGSMIAAGGSDGSIHIWDASDGEQIIILRGHRSEVSTVQFAADSQTLVAAENSGRILVWTLDLDRLIEIARGRLTRDFTDDECRTHLHIDSCSER